MMNPIRFLIVIGFMSIIIAFLGVPQDIKFWLYIGIGIAIFANAYVLKKQYYMLRKRIKELQSTEVYGK